MPAIRPVGSHRFQRTRQEPCCDARSASSRSPPASLQGGRTPGRGGGLPSRALSLPFFSGFHESAFSYHSESTLRASCLSVCQPSRLSFLPPPSEDTQVEACCRRAADTQAHPLPLFRPVSLFTLLRSLRPSLPHPTPPPPHPSRPLTLHLVPPVQQRLPHEPARAHRPAAPPPARRPAPTLPAIRGRLERERRGSGRVEGARRGREGGRDSE